MWKEDTVPPAQLKYKDKMHGGLIWASLTAHAIPVIAGTIPADESAALISGPPPSPRRLKRPSSISRIGIERRARQSGTKDLRYWIVSAVTPWGATSAIQQLFKALGELAQGVVRWMFRLLLNLKEDSPSAGNKFKLRMRPRQWRDCCQLGFLKDPVTTHELRTEGETDYPDEEPSASFAEREAERTVVVKRDVDPSRHGIFLNSDRDPRLLLPSSILVSTQLAMLFSRSTQTFEKKPNLR
ncbi:hypothetical protein B0H19DRAFT_1072270 [Mycena capillaripes]|nr:hypothetical protein B0H19DRAFT_1072270 [Mycena capillaripes]